MSEDASVDACCMRTKRGCLLQDDASCMIMILEREAEASFFLDGLKLNFDEGASVDACYMAGGASEDACYMVGGESEDACCMVGIF